MHWSGPGTLHGSYFRVCLRVEVCQRNLPSFQHKSILTGLDWLRKANRPAVRRDAERPALLCLQMWLWSRSTCSRSKPSQRKYEELRMFPSQAYAEGSWAHPDADLVRGARMGESETPRVRENRLLHEVHTMPPHRISHGAKTA